MDSKKLYKLFIPIWFSPAYARLERINKKKKQRMQRIDEAYKYLQEWNDIPISQLYGSVCDILKIQRNQAAKELIWRMNFDMDPIDVARRIPLERENQADG